MINETFEYSEIIWEVILKAAMERNYADIAQLTSAMAARRTVDGSVYIYDSMAVKKVFDNLNRKEVLGMFVEELIRAKYERAEQIRNILVDISSEEVALALTNIISHPARNVRQQVLKILGCLGEASVKVCSEILSEDNMFNREEGRHELPDEKWYVIRNAIFVLGILGNLTGVAALRKRISDLDVRVRREIITALEKIGGEDASDILSMMADDHIYEIQEKAVITIGLIGNSDVIPLLDNIAHSKKALSATCIISIAKIGGKEAKEYLNKLFDNQELQDTLSGGESSREDIKLALIKALGILGDKNSIKKIKEFQSIQSATQKFFFKNSSVSKIINDILSKK